MKTIGNVNTNLFIFKVIDMMQHVEPWMFVQAAVSTNVSKPIKYGGRLQSSEWACRLLLCSKLFKNT